MNDLYLEYQRDVEVLYFMKNGRDASDHELKDFMKEFSFFEWANFNCYSYKGEK